MKRLMFALALVAATGCEPAAPPAEPLASMNPMDETAEAVRGLSATTAEKPAWPADAAEATPGDLGHLDVTQALGEAPSGLLGAATMEKVVPPARLPAVEGHGLTASGLSDRAALSLDPVGDAGDLGRALSGRGLSLPDEAGRHLLSGARDVKAAGYLE